MGYEQTKFGDGSAAGSGNVTRTVSNHYGARDTGKTSGITNSGSFIRELSLDIDGTMVGNAAYPLIAPIVPANSRIEDVFLEVSEAFVLGGTTPAVEVGTETSESTNGVTFTEAQMEAVGVYDVTSALSGTWSASAGFAADTTVGLALSGTSPTVTSAGKARVVIRYFHA